MTTKILLALLIFLIYPVVGSSQVLVDYKVIDAISLNPIPYAVITEDGNNKIVETGINGRFSMDGNSSFTISAAGYNSRSIIPNSKTSRIIALEPNLEVLDEIVLQSSNIPLKRKFSQQNISFLSENDISLANSHDLSSIINNVPGVFMQSATLNTNRIAIRGIGARNLFGTANIRAYYGDIPLTDGNGESAIEDLELVSLSSITVLKGPSASTYGVGLGGTIIYQPKHGFGEFNSFNITSIFGSYGFNKHSISSNFKLKNSGFNFVFSDTHSDGYRDNNNYRRKSLSLTSKIYMGTDDELDLIVNYVDLKGEIPSSLSNSDFDDNPRKAAFTWGRAMAYEDLDYGLLGMSWTHSYKSDLSQITSINTSFRKNYEPRPFNILDENSNTIGIRSRILGNIGIGIAQWEFSVGGEMFYDFYNNRTFENLYQQFDDGRGSVQGNQLSALKERRNYFNLFVENNLKLSNRLTINGGLNLNKTVFKVEDTFNNSEIANNGNFNFQYILSPKIGYSYQINESLISFGNISHGFSTPTTAETLLPDGIFNPDIKPEIGWSFENGIRYYLLNNKLSGSLSVYKMLISDLLVSRRTEEDNFFSINAGNSTHNGLESTLNYNIWDHKNYNLQAEFGLSLHDYRFKEFIDLENDFSGKTVTGVPSHVLNFQLKLLSSTKFYGKIGYQHVGRMFANDANSVSNNSYTLLNAKFGHRGTIFKSFVYDMHFSANNILNEKYASQLQINAIGFGNNDPRYFYPGLPVNFFGGVSIRYKF